MDLKGWKNRIKKRGIAFFRFVTNWSNYVVRFANKDGIPWQDIPGYATLVKAILYELKLRGIKYYPDALKETCCALLANENMLTVFVNILFHKTPVYDHYTVDISLSFVTLLFNSLHKEHRKSPPSNFDFQLFFNGIDTLLKMDDLLSCEKCLWMIYKIAHLLPSNYILYNIDKERGIILYRKLIGQNFYKLFFHWSFNVRLLFHIIMLYQCRNWFENV